MPGSTSAETSLVVIDDGQVELDENNHVKA